MSWTYADESLETIKASARTTPHRHFSQRSCRHPPDQPGTCPSPVPLATALLDVGVGLFNGRTTGGVAGASRVEDEGCEGAMRAGGTIVVGVI